MKKKLLFLVVFVISLMCLLVVSASAVTDDEKNMTLGDCTIAGLDGVTIPSPTRGLEYSFDDKNKTATITGRGSFVAGSAMVIPSTVTYGEKTYTVVSVSDKFLNQVDTSAVYIPDSFTTPTFEMLSNANRGEIYIGSGIKEFPQEFLSNAQGITKFVCKSKPTKIGQHAFHMANCSTSAKIAEYELDLSNVEEIVDYGFNQSHIVTYANFSSKLKSIGTNGFCKAKYLAGTVIIPEGCSLSHSTFNGCESLSLAVINVAEGEVKEIPAQLFSASGTNDFVIVITGRVNIANEEPLPGKNETNQKIYFPTIKIAQEFIDDIVKNNVRRERLQYIAFYICEDAGVYNCSSAGVLSAKEGATFGHAYSELQSLEADCSNFAREAYVCYACGNENITMQGTEYGDHVVECVTEKEATCSSKGYKEYTCTVCNIQYVADWQDSIPHTIKDAEYTVDGLNITIKGACINCGGAETTTTISLENKCYIEGYGLFDATLDLISVSADGVVTPNPSATFNKSVIYFPSYVQLGDEIVKVEKIQGFKGKSLKEIYVPDTVNELVSPSNSSNGCFGDISTLTTIVVGKGVTKLGREVFSMGNGATITTFIFKGVITELGQHSLQGMDAGEGLVYELNTRLTSIGMLVNSGRTLLKEVYITYDCTIADKAFNGALGVKTCYIEGGKTLDKAKSIPTEFFSGNTSDLCIYMNGYVTVGGNHIAPTYGASWYFETKAHMVEFLKSAAGRQGNERFANSSFYTCEDVGETVVRRWRVAASEITEALESSDFYHDAYGEQRHQGFAVTRVESTCSSTGSLSSSCFMCEKALATTPIEQLEHDFDGGVITTAPNCKDLGVIIYSCLNCGAVNEKSIFCDYETHEYQAMLLYPNGFAQAGIENTFCKICFDKMYEDKALDVIITVEGYSVKNNRTGISCGFGVNLKALAYYEQKTGTKVEIGVIISNAQDAKENGLVNEAYKLLSTNRGIQVEILGRNYSFIKVNVNGFNTDALKALDLIMTSYIVADLNGDGEMEISYIQHTMDGKDNKPVPVDGISFNTVSIDRASPLVAQDALLPTGNSENE